jgi:hypothetical protein
MDNEEKCSFGNCLEVGEFDCYFCDNAMCPKHYYEASSLKGQMIFKGHEIQTTCSSFVCILKGLETIVMKNTNMIFSKINNLHKLLSNLPL